MNARTANISTLVAILLASTAYAGAGTWTSGAPLPTARQGASAATIGGKIFVIGGYSISGCMNTVEIFDPGTRQCGGGRQ